MQTSKREAGSVILTLCEIGIGVLLLHRLFRLLAAKTKAKTKEDFSCKHSEG